MKLLKKKYDCAENIAWKVEVFQWLKNLQIRLTLPIMTSNLYKKTFLNIWICAWAKLFSENTTKYVKILNWRLFPYRFGEIFEEVWVPRLLTELLDRRHPHVARNCKQTPQFVCDTLVQCIKHKTVGFAFRFTLNWTNITLIYWLMQEK